MRERAINIKLKLGIQMTTDMTEEEKEEAGMIGEANRKEKPKIPAIPIPPIYEVADYANQKFKKWQPPHHYIKFFTSIGADVLTEFDYYELTVEDVEFLKEFNEKEAKSRTGGAQITAKNFEKMIELWEKECDEITKSTDPEAEYPLKIAGEHAEKHLAITGNFVPALYAYWRQKRLDRKGALMRQYQQPPTVAGPHHAFVPRLVGRRHSSRNPKKNEPIMYSKMRYLKKDFEDVLDILNLMRKREVVKRHKTLVDVEEFDFRLSQSKWYQRFKPEREKLNALLLAEETAKSEQRSKTEQVYLSTEVRPNSSDSIAGAAGGPDKLNPNETVENWWNVAPPVFDQNLTKDELIVKLLATNLPKSDFTPQLSVTKPRVTARKPIKMRNKKATARKQQKMSAQANYSESDEKYSSSGDSSDGSDFLSETSSDETFYAQVDKYLWDSRRNRRIPSGGMGLSGGYLLAPKPKSILASSSVESSPAHPSIAGYEDRIDQDEWSSEVADAEEDSPGLILNSDDLMGRYRKPSPFTDPQDGPDRKDYSRASFARFQRNLRKRQLQVANPARATLTSGIDSDENSDDHFGPVAFAREGRCGRVWLEVLDSPPSPLRKIMKLAQAATDGTL